MDESKYVTESVLINPNQSKKKIPQKKPSKEKSKEIKKKEKIFINDECSLCKKKLEDVKYICSICNTLLYQPQKCLGCLSNFCIDCIKDGKDNYLLVNDQYQFDTLVGVFLHEEDNESSNDDTFYRYREEEE